MPNTTSSGREYVCPYCGKFDILADASHCLGCDREGRQALREAQRTAPIADGWAWLRAWLLARQRLTLTDPAIHDEWRHEIAECRRQIRLYQTALRRAKRFQPR